MRTDGWADRHDEANSHLSQFLRTPLKMLRQEQFNKETVMQAGERQNGAEYN